MTETLSYRNQSIDLRSKTVDWFLYDNGLRRERVKKTRLTIKVLENLHGHLSGFHFFNFWFREEGNPRFSFRDMIASRYHNELFLYCKIEILYLHVNYMKVHVERNCNYELSAGLFLVFYLCCCVIFCYDTTKLNGHIRIARWKMCLKEFLVFLYSFSLRPPPRHVFFNLLLRIRDMIVKC